MARRGLIPTPTVRGNYNKKGLSPSSGDGLATFVREAGGESGPLAPSFLEWMMGWPTGYSLPTGCTVELASDSAETASFTPSPSPCAGPSPK